MLSQQMSRSSMSLSDSSSSLSASSKSIPSYPFKSIKSNIEDEKEYNDCVLSASLQDFPLNDNTIFINPRKTYLSIVYRDENHYYYTNLDYKSYSQHIARCGIRKLQNPATYFSMLKDAIINKRYSFEDGKVTINYNLSDITITGYLFLDLMASNIAQDIIETSQIMMKMKARLEHKEKEATQPELEVTKRQPAPIKPSRMSLLNPYMKKRTGPRGVKIM